MWQVREAGHYPQECSEAEASVGEMAGWSRTLEPEGPAEPDGVRWRGTLQKTQAAHQFHPAGHRSPELLLQEERFAHGTGNHRNCPRAELWQRGGSGVVLQPATDVEKHEQNQRVPGAAVRIPPDAFALWPVEFSEQQHSFRCCWSYRFNGKKCVWTVWESLGNSEYYLLYFKPILSLICVVSTQTKVHGHFISDDNKYNTSNVIITFYKRCLREHLNYLKLQFPNSFLAYWLTRSCLNNC